MSVRKLIAAFAAEAHAAFPKRLRRLMVFFNGPLVYHSPAAKETVELFEEQGNMEEIIKDDQDFMHHSHSGGFSQFMHDGKHLLKKVVLGRTGTRLLDIWHAFHEIGHWCVPGAYVGHAPIVDKDRRAEAFAALCHAKFFSKQGHFLVSQELHAAISLVELGDREHYFGDTVAAVREFVKKEDVTKKSLPELAKIAFDIAATTAVPAPVIKKLVAAFKPLRAPKKLVRQRIGTKKFANDFSAVVARHAKDKDICLAAERYIMFMERWMAPTPAFKKAMKTLDLTY